MVGADLKEGKIDLIKEGSDSNFVTFRSFFIGLKFIKTNLVHE